jgi:hypothetical protein
MRSQKKSAGLAAVALLLLLASSCSGSSPDAAPTPPETSPPEGTGPPPTATSAPTPVPFDPGRVRIRLEQAGSGFSEPLFVTGAGDGSGRVFVLEKTGRVRLLDGGTFLDIRDRVKSPALQSYDREQGLSRVPTQVLEQRIFLRPLQRPRGQPCRVALRRRQQWPG